MLLNSGDTISENEQKTLTKLSEFKEKIYVRVSEEKIGSDFSEFSLANGFYTRIFQSPTYSHYEPIFFEPGQKINEKKFLEITIRRKNNLLTDKFSFFTENPLGLELALIVSEIEEKFQKKIRFVELLSQQARKSQANQLNFSEKLDTNILRDEYLKLLVSSQKTLPKIFEINRKIESLPISEQKKFENWYYVSVKFLIEIMNDFNLSLKILLDKIHLFPVSSALFSLLYQIFCQTGNFPISCRILNYLSLLTDCKFKSEVRLEENFTNPDFLNFLKTVSHYFCIEYEACFYYFNLIREKEKYLEGYYQIKAAIEGNFSRIKELEDNKLFFSMAFKHLCLARQFSFENKRIMAEENYKKALELAYQEKNLFIFQEINHELLFFSNKLNSGHFPNQALDSRYLFYLTRATGDNKYFEKLKQIEEIKLKNISLLFADPEKLSREKKNFPFLELILSNVPEPYLEATAKKTPFSLGKKDGEKKYWEIINQAFNLFNILQIKEEFFELLKEVNKIKPGVVLEIGTYEGGSLFAISRLAKIDALLIGIDLSFPKENFLIEQIKKINPEQQLKLIRGNSQAPETVKIIKSVLKDKKIDLLFIDGDHSYQGVKTDYQFYSPLVRKGGMIVFHDIKIPDTVNKFWREVNYSGKNREITSYQMQDGLGIGIIYC